MPVVQPASWAPAVALLALASAGVSSGAGTSDEGPRPLATRSSAPIAFLRDYGTEEQPRNRLVIMDPAGTNERIVKLPHNADVFEFSWSLDGRRLAFVAAASSPWYWLHLYVVNADGTGLRELRKLPDAGAGPKWSPRGNLIAFDMQNDGAHAVWVIRPDGSEARKLTRGWRFSNPVWSPSGRKIAYSPYATPHAWVRLMNPDGSHKRKFTRLNTGAWTSRGLTYSNQSGIGFVRRDGSAGGVAFHFGYQWQHSYPSRDGRAVLLSGPILPHGDWEIAIATKSGVRRLTENDRQDIDPSLAPDRKSLVFEAMSTPAYGEPAPPGDIYVINSDGSGERNLTNSPQSESFPSWAPAGGR